MTRNLFFAALLALTLGAAPAFAKDDSGDATSAPVPVSAKADNVNQSLSEAPSSEQAMLNAWPIAPRIAPSDTLANFGPSSGTVVGNRALSELRDEVLRLRASVNLNSNEFAILAVQRCCRCCAVSQHGCRYRRHRLQNGTTRGNLHPITLSGTKPAPASDEVNLSSLSRLNSLQTAIDADASMASYLLEPCRPRLNCPAPWMKITTN